MTEALDLIVELLELSGLGYVIYRLRQQKLPELRDLVKQALARRAETGKAFSGRERLRARLLQKEERNL